MKPAAAVTAAFITKIRRAIMMQTSVGLKASAPLAVYGAARCIVTGIAPAPAR